jgi:hypothetical protein
MTMKHRLDRTSRYKTSRNLEYRIIKGVNLFYNYRSSTYKSKYTGEGNLVWYKGEEISVNKWCHTIIKNINPEIKTPSLNVWRSVYVNIKTQNKENKKNRSKGNNKYMKVKLQDIPILPEQKKFETEILNNTYLHQDSGCAMQ